MFTLYIIIIELLQLFHRHHFEGKPVEALQSTSCFHRLGHKIYTKIYSITNACYILLLTLPLEASVKFLSVHHFQRLSLHRVWSDKPAVCIVMPCCNK